MGKIHRRHRSRSRRRGGVLEHAKDVILGHETRTDKAKRKAKDAMGKVTSGAKNLMKKFKGLFGGRRRTRKRRRRRHKRRRHRRRTKRHHRRHRRRTKRHHRRHRRRTRRHRR